MMQQWVKLPSVWIEKHGLKEFSWKNGGADNTAALMALIVIAHHADETGMAKMTYDDLCMATSISRAKLSRGLNLLEGLGVIRRWQNGRSSYQLVGYDPERGWCKLPAKSLYKGKAVKAFQDFGLRKRAELNALKLYLLFAARRDRKTNHAKIGYEKICEYSGVQRGDIKSALSLLVTHDLIHVERDPSAINDYGVANAYRLAGLETYMHMGTTGRHSAEAF